MDILANWLGFPSQADSYAKARFLNLIAVQASPNLLYLNITDTAFQYLKCQVLGKNCFKKSTINIFDTFKENLSKYPICNLALPEFCILLEIKEIYNVV